MKRRTQTIDKCTHCGKVFQDGEDYWDADRGDCYCDENKCGWEEEYYKD